MRNPTASSRRVASTFALVPLLAAAASAQCVTDWLPGATAPGTNGPVRVCAPWDPDGPGPLPAVLVLAGDFTVAGGVLANRIAVCDPATGACAALGTGMDGPVQAVAVMSNGDLVAGGSFTTAGGAGASFVARWNGASWSPLGPGLSPVGPGITQNGVRALTVLPAGDVVAGGQFHLGGGAVPCSIARWDGIAWVPLGTGVAHPQTVRALAVMPTGELIAGGVFQTIGGVACNYIASWNGTSWSPLGSGINTPTTYAEVHALLVLPNGDLIVGGGFQLAGGATAHSVARWSGSAWSPLGTGIAQPFTSSWVMALAALPNGTIVAGGSFGLAGGTPAASIASWDGVAWSPLGSGVAGSSAVLALATQANGDVVAGGYFTSAGGVNAPYSARWSGAAWAALPQPTALDGAVHAVAAAPNGDVIAGGDFHFAGTTSLEHIGRRTAAGWSPLGTGIDGPVRAVCVRANGDVIAGGTFSSAGGVAAGNLARWNGALWVAMPFVSPVNALLALPNGDVYVGGVGGVQRWNGVGMVPLGTGVGLGALTPFVNALAMLPNGDLVVGGGFTTAGGGIANAIARWNGSTWSTFGPGFTGWLSYPPAVRSLGVLQNGDVVASGFFMFAGASGATGCMRWDGATWNTMGASPAMAPAMITLPDGGLVVSSPGAANLQRWNGATWSAFGAATDAGVSALAYLSDGRVAAGGWFTSAGAQVSAYYGTLASGCPATASAFGAGCVGSGGTNTLTATALPWLGATFRAQAAGLPASVSLVAAVYGFSAIPAVPLSALLAQGGAGCTLDVSPDVHFVYVNAGGVLPTELPIPAAPSLIGASFHQQVVPFELDALGNIVLVTSTNALTATIGVL